MKSSVPSCVALILLACAAAAYADTPVPAPGTSPRVDAIKKAGVLRVGVLANAPWLVENTTGSGEKWSGPAWLLAEEYAKRLGVKLEAVPVSHETKVPVLASNPVFDELFGDFPLLFERDDAASLVERLRWIASLSPEERSEIGRALRRRVAERHSVETWADGVLAAAR